MESLNKISALRQHQELIAKVVSTGFIEAIKSHRELIEKIKPISGLESITRFSNSYIGISKAYKSITKNILSYNLNEFGSFANSFKASQTPFADSLNISALTKFATQHRTLLDQLSVNYKLYNDFDSTDKTSAFASFNAASIAIKEFSQNFIGSVISESDWDTLESFNEVSAMFSEINSDFTSTEKLVTDEDLVRYKRNIIDRLFLLLQGVTNPVTREIIFQWMGLFSFILPIYFPSFYKSDDISNKEVVIYNQKIVEKLSEELRTEFREEIKKAKTLRVAIEDNALRASRNLNSKKLSLIKEGQEVYILKPYKKWLLISFTDDDTKEPKTGYVYKEYFDIIE